MPSSPVRPPRTAVLWRYMNLEKLIHMLYDQGVYFSYPGKLEDPFEGSLPTQTIKRLRFLNVAELIEHSTKQGHVKSCWHEMDHESDAMWRFYAGKGAGIAVRTNIESLMESMTPGWIDDPHDTFMAGRVSYVNFDTDDIPVLNGMPLFYKRNAFSHEKEVRIACFENESVSMHGVTYHAEMENLIHEIVVSPLAEDWEFRVVVETTKRFSETLARKVCKSTIAKPTTLEYVLEKKKKLRTQKM